MNRSSSSGARRGARRPATRGTAASGRAGRGRSAASAPDAREAPAHPRRTDVPLRVGFVPGVEPDRFARRWRTGPRPAPLELVPVAVSHQARALDSREVDMCFVRLPLPADIAAHLHLVELWEERPAIVVGHEHVLSLLEEITDADLAEETEIPVQHPDDAADRVAVAATGVGYARMPLSLARLHHRKDAVHRPHLDGSPTRIALAWPRDADDDMRQEFVGAVRGRTPRSSR